MNQGGYNNEIDGGEGETERSASAFVSPSLVLETGLTTLESGRNRVKDKKKDGKGGKKIQETTEGGRADGSRVAGPRGRWR